MPGEESPFIKILTAPDYGGGDGARPNQQHYVHDKQEDEDHEEQDDDDHDPEEPKGAGIRCVARKVRHFRKSERTELCNSLFHNSITPLND